MQSSKKWPSQKRIIKKHISNFRYFKQKDQVEGRKASILFSSTLFFLTIQIDSIKKLGTF